MVLKRKRGDEFVPVYGQDSQSLPTTSEQESGAKKLRVNPPRSARTAPIVETSMSIPPTAVLPKKTRVPRKKKADPVEPTPDSGSSMPLAGPSQPTAPAKRGRKKKVTDDQSEPEKRKAQFKPRCPQNILDRVERVMTQRFFMIERQRDGDELRENFKVLGSTGNVYTVNIDHLPQCNCPDSIKGNHCKHILFVFLKVLGVSRESGFWYQKALLTSELEQIFREARLAPTAHAHAHARVLEAYARATGKAVEEPTDSTGKKRLPSEEDDCPVCYDSMHGVGETSLVFCEECGNALHKECFAEWRKTSQRTGKELTCVYCRARWVFPGPSGGPSGGATVLDKAKGGYVNLAAVAGFSPVRDTSTYYHGPRRGARNYGYNNYDD